uniref:Kaptin n=1 Tax=Lygus hesperus TaxID=30085 RepID=A0A0K8SJ50_LYGHE
MNSFQDAHYYNLPSQGNVYTYVNLSLTNGTNRALFGILKRKVFCCEFTNDGGGGLIPAVKEVPFTYIPAGAEIISMDAFNRSSNRDNFIIGISIIKVTSDQCAETYLNVYTEQDVDENASLNLESIAQNCLMLELAFTPYQLYHSYVINQDHSKEVVWLLSGSDVKVHLFREDPQNHTYCETEIEGIFPEFNAIASIILWMDIKHTADLKRRITAYGCECGVSKMVVVDSFSGDTLQEFTEYYDAPVTRVGLFSFSKTIETQNLDILADPGWKKLEAVERKKMNESTPWHLLVVNALRVSAVFMDVVENGLKKKHLLPDSDKFDAAITSCIADIDMDGKPEILLGTFSQMMLVYKFDGKWRLSGLRRFSHAVHSIGYTDLSGDGAKELIVATMSGIHILQHNPVNVLKEFYGRLNPALKMIQSSNIADGSADESVDE